VRRRVGSSLAAVLVLLVVRAEPARAEGGPPPADPKALARALEIESELVGALDRVRRSTVAVLNMKRIGGVANAPVVSQSCGSGVLVQQRGTWVVTNVHVVEGADEVRVVTSDGERHVVRVVDTVDRYDIALLGFVKEPRGLRGVPVKAVRGLEEGSWVLATGNPFWLAVDGQSVATVGVVSGLDRILGGRFLYGKAIQHDAEVNPGNSGGPLWNLRGDLVGINGMIASQQTDGAAAHNTGASFSIPSEQLVRYLADMIARRENTAAGDLGVTVETSVDKDGRPNGARIVEVNAQMHAGRKDLQRQDVITRVVPKGQAASAIHTANDLVNLLSLLPAGTSVKVSYRRENVMAIWSGVLKPH
jgi:S1-C subfamily serine protease